MRSSDMDTPPYPEVIEGQVEVDECVSKGRQVGQLLEEVCLEGEPLSSLHHAAEDGYFFWGNEGLVGSI